MRGGSGLRDGVGVGALLNAPAGMAASSSDVGAAAYLADAGSHALRAVSLTVTAKLTREYSSTRNKCVPRKVAALTHRAPPPGPARSGRDIHGRV